MKQPNKQNLKQINKQSHFCLTRNDNDYLCKSHTYTLFLLCIVLFYSLVDRNDSNEDYFVKNAS